MKVWIVEPVGYDQYGILGVFDSLEAAKASIDYYEWELVRGEWITKGRARSANAATRFMRITCGRLRMRSRRRRRDDESVR